MTENNGLAIRRESIIHNYDDAMNAATVMAKSGFFQDTRDASQAMVKILAGQEMGFGAFASMSGIFIIQGRPSIGANLMASAVKGSWRYDYRVKEMSDSVCEIQFFERTGGKLEPIGVSKFTIEDAKKAQTKNLDKFPRNMLFARAISNGVKWYCPDVFNGAAVYTPEELGAEVDGDGNVINIEPEIIKVAQNQSLPKPTIQPQEMPEPEFEEPPMEMPEPKTDKSKSKMTYEQAMKDLGFSVDPKPVKDNQPRVNVPMTYDEAANVIGSKGEKYGNLNDVELKGKKFGLTKIVNKAETTDEDRAAAMRKLEAVNVLLSVPESKRLERAGNQKLI